MKANAIKSILMLAVAALVLAVAPAGFGADGGDYLALDDRPGLHGPGRIATTKPSEQFVPGVTDFGRSPARTASDDMSAVVISSGSADVPVVGEDFDWGSAGIGAGAAAGAILAAIGAVLFVRSSRTRTQAT